MKNTHKLDQTFFGACMNPKLNQVEYKFFAFTHIIPFIFVVSSILTIIPISHNNIRSSNHSPTMIDMFMENIKLERQEFIFSINGKTYDTLDLRN